MHCKAKAQNSKHGKYLVSDTTRPIYTHSLPHRECSNIHRRPARVQTRENPSAEEGNECKVLPITKTQFTIYTCLEREISLFQLSNTGYVNHTPGQAPHSGENGQHKMAFFLGGGLFQFCIFCITGLV